MRFPSKGVRLLAFFAAVLVAFYLGRLSVPSRPPQIISPVVAPTVEHEPATQPGSRAIAEATTPEPPRPAPVSVSDWEIHWRDLAARPGSRLRDQEILAMIEELATRDPARALSLAEAESNMRLRLEMYRAALRGWAKVAPEAAADWALSSQTAIERTDAIAAALAGTAKNPDAALKLTNYLIEKDPAHSRDHGVALIAALAGTGEFERAAHFAATGNEDNREDWMTTAYSTWADYQPDAAMASVNALSDPTAKRNAFNAAVNSWSSNDPKTVANYADGLDSGEDKKFAITVALRNWAGNDAVEAANWIRQRDPSPELDAGAAAVATDSQNFRQPAVAAEWAESITDPELRSATLLTVIREWAEQDRAGAQNYFKASTGLRPNDRSELLADFEATKNQ